MCIKFYVSIAAMVVSICALSSCAKKVYPDGNDIKVDVQPVIKKAGCGCHS